MSEEVKRGPGRPKKVEPDANRTSATDQLMEQIFPTENKDVVSVGKGSAEHRQVWLQALLSAATAFQVRVEADIPRCVKFADAVLDTYTKKWK